MLNKKGLTKGTSVILLTSLVMMGFLAVVMLGSFSGLWNTMFHGGYPHYAVVVGTSKLSCLDESIYDKNWLPYETRVNVQIVNSQDEAEALSNNNKFIMDLPMRGLSDSASNYVIGKGIPPQVKCDGTKDCSFGFMNTGWIYNPSKDKCFIQECEEASEKCEEGKKSICNYGQWNEEGDCEEEVTEEITEENIAEESLEIKSVENIEEMGFFAKLIIKIKALFSNWEFF